MSNLSDAKLNLIYEDKILNDIQKNTINNNNLTKNSNKSLALSESISLILYTVSVSFYGAGNFHMKYIQIKHPLEYDMFSFIFWRNIIFISIVYLLIRYKNIEILDARKLQKTSQIWLCIRTFGQFLAIIFTLSTLEKLRVGTANTFISMTPAAVILLCVFLLKERFHWRYPLGVVICFFGGILIISNEGKAHQSLSAVNNSEQIDSRSDTLIGVFWGVCNLFCIASLVISTKALNNDKINYENICFYVGGNNLICSIIVIVFIKMHFSFGFYFVLHSIFNACMYFFATYFHVISLNGVDVLKTTSLGYVQTVVGTFLGVLVLGENVYFSDFIGSLIIIGYNIYNALYPVKF